MEGMTGFSSASRMSVPQKVLAVFLSVILVFGLSPFAKIPGTTAYADDAAGTQTSNHEAPEGGETNSDSPGDKATAGGTAVDLTAGTISGGGAAGDAATTNETPVVAGTTDDGVVEGGAGEGVEPTRGAGDGAEGNVVAIGETGYATFEGALNAAQTGDTITLLADLDLTAADNYTSNRIPISNSITIDGAGNTITVANRGFGVGVGATDKIDVTFKDVTIVNTADAGRCIDTRGNIGSLTLDGATLKTTGTSGYTQPLTIGGNQPDPAKVTITDSTIQTNDEGTAYYAIITYNPVNMTIDKSTIKGWANIYAKGKDGSAGSAGSVFTIKDSTLVSKNVYSGTSNAFAMFNAEDDNVKFNVTNSEIEIIAASDQKQAIATTQKQSVEVSLGEGNTVTLAGENAVVAFNSAKPVITGGTFVDENGDAVDVSEYLAEGYTQNESGEIVELVVAKIGETTYASLEDAFAAAQAGDTIVLLKDVTDIGQVDIPAGSNVTLDLAGYSIETALSGTDRHYYAFDNFGTFTLKDSVGGGVITGRGIVNESSGVMVVEGGTVVACDSNGGAAVWNEGTLTVNGGTLKVTHVGTPNDTYGAGALNNSGTATINGGTFDSVNRRTYAIVSTGDITVNNAAVSGAHGGLAIDAGTAVINDGSFASTDYYGLYVSNDGTGTDPETAQVTVNGGTFTGSTYSVFVGSDINDPVNSAVEITGGTFNKPLKVQDNVAEGSGIVAKGGTFSDELPAAYIAEGFELSDNGDGTYTVAPAVTLTATLDKESYTLTGSTATIKATVARSDGQALTADDKADWTVADSTGFIGLSGSVSFNSSGVATIKIARTDSTSLSTVTVPVAIVHGGTAYAETTVAVSPTATITTDKANRLVEEGAETVTALKVNGTAVDVADYAITSDDVSAATVSQDGGTITITPLKAGKATFTVAKADDSSKTATASITFSNAAARIGDAYYKTVKDAMNAAQSGDTVVLCADATESVPFSGTSPRVNGFELTVDLAGHTWTGAANQPYTLRVDYGIVTVTDSVGGGGVAYGKDYAFIVSHLAGDYTSKLVLESGTFTGKTSVVQVGYPGGSGANYKYYGGELVVNGGTFVTVPDEGEAYDESGHFKYTLNMLDMNEPAYAGGIYSPSSITVNGGTFVNFDPSNNVAEGADTNFVAAGKTVFAGEDAGVATYTVAEAVAKIGETGYATLAEAVAAAQSGETIEILKADTYTLPNLPQNITVKGNVDGVVFSHTGSGNVAAIPNGATFENVTFNFGNVNYHGFQHAGTINMNDCTINGKLFSYADMNFTGCTFNAPGTDASGITDKDYSMWVYSGDVAYTNCTFNGAGKFLNVYNESGATRYEVTANDCKFVNSGAANKAAFNVKETSGSNVLLYTVNINNCTTEGAFPEAGTSTNNDGTLLTVISGLVQVDDRVAGGTENGGEIIVNVDGTQAYITPAVAKVAAIGEAQYKTLQAALDAAHEMTGDVTVTLLADINEVAIVHQKAGLNLTIDGAEKTITGQIYVDGDARYEGTDTLTIQNVKFAYDAATYDEAFVFMPSTKTTGKPYTTGKYNYAHNVTVTGCEFAGEGTTTVAVRVASGAGANGLTINGNTATAGHSLAQLTGVKNLTVTNNNVTGVKNGINISGGEGVATISGNTLTAEGYTVRLKDASGMAVTLSDNELSGSEGLVSSATRGGSIIVASGKYAGPLPTEGTKFTVQGGLFTVAPAQAVCAEGKYPMANTDEATKADYPYTVGEAVASVDGLGYTTFEAAVAAANSGEKVVTLLANIEDDYTLEAGTLKVAKGEFELTVVAPEGSVLKESTAEGVTTYTVTGAVAKIGETLYGSLAEAIAAVPADGTATTITMIADENIEVSGYALTVPAGKNVVLDLNGKTVSGTCTTGAGSALIRNQGTLTIMDGASEGALSFSPDPSWVYSAENPGGYASNLIRNEGALTINGGRLYNSGTGSAAYAIDNYNAATIAVNGGAIDTKKASAVRMFYNNGGSINVTGGTIGHYTSADDCTYMGIQVQAGTGATVNISGGTIAGDYAFYTTGGGTSSVDISGGVLDGYVGIGSSASNNVAISGGSFTAWVGTWGSHTGFISGGYYAVEPDAEYIVEGKGAIASGNADYPYTIDTVVAKIGNTNYTSLANANRAAVDGDTITMVSNDTVTEEINVSKNITLDLNGCTITSDRYHSGSSQLSSTIWVSDNLTIVDSSNGAGKIKNTSQDGIQDGGNAVYVEGTLNFEGGAVDSAHTGIKIFSGTVNVNGGNVYGKAFGVLLTGSGTVNINDGVIRAVSHSVSHRHVNQGGTFNLNGGYFSDANGNNDEFTRAGGKMLVKVGGDGDYKDYYELNTAVAKTSKINIGMQYYSTLQAAIDAADDGKTVEMLSSTNETVVVPADKSITLDLAGNNITGSGASTIVNNGTLTINDASETPGIITTTSGDYVIQNLGTMTINGGKVFKNEELTGAMIANGWYDPNTAPDNASAKLTINGGDFEGGWYNVKNDDFGTLTVNGGTFTNGVESNILNVNDATITGGTFNATNTASVFGDFRSEGADAENAEYVVSGGTFNYASNGYGAYWNYGAADETNPISVTGGYWSDDQLNSDNATMPEGKHIVYDSVSGYYVIGTAAAKIGNTYYATLQAAVDAAVDGDTVVLLADAADENGVVKGNGVIITTANAKNITIDLGGLTYDIDGETVGSTGTQSQAFHFEKGSTIKLQNGTVTSSKASMLVQNYCDLTLENVKLDGTKMAGDGNYALSNNNGNVTIGEGTEISVGEGKVAFDVYNWPKNGYTDGAHVTVHNGATINGNVEVTTDGSEGAPASELTINGGTFNGKLTVDGAYADTGNVKINAGTFAIAPPTALNGESQLVKYPLAMYPVKGAGEDAPYTIALSVASPDIEVVADGEYIYTGEQIKPEVIVKVKGETADPNNLVEIAYAATVVEPGAVLDTDDYELDYGENINVGEGTIIVTGKGQFAGSTTREFEILPSEIAVADIANVTYTGSAITPDVAVTVNGIPLPATEGEGESQVVNYTIAYAIDSAVVGNNAELSNGLPLNAGAYTVTITPEGNYATADDQPIVKSFVVDPKNITDSDVVMSGFENNLDFAGAANAVMQDLTFTWGAIALDPTSDYTVGYADNTSTGMATITITGVGNYTGEISRNFSINGVNISDATVTIDPDEFVYDGTEKKPTTVTVVKTINGVDTELVEGTDYLITYYNDVNAGEAAVFIVGIGGFTGAKVVEYTIKPAEVEAPTATSYDFDGTEKTGVAVPADAKYAVAGNVVATDPGDYLAIATLKDAKNYVWADTKDTAAKELAWSIGAVAAKIGNTYYKTLAEAIAAAAEGDTIELLIDVAENAVLADGKNVTLDLGGHALTGYVDVYDADVTIANGVVEGTVYANGSATDAPYGHVTIAENAIVDSDYGVIVYQSTADGNKGYGATVDIYGAVEGMVWVMGNIVGSDKNLGTNPSTINVHDGASVVGDDVGIALNGAAVVNIEGGDIMGTATGIEVRAGQLNVSGGNVVGMENETVVTPSGSGTTTSGAGIAIAQHTTKLPIAVNVTGGHIEGPTAVYQSDPQGNGDAANVAVTLSDGVFIATSDDGSAVFTADENVVIEGGAYSDNGDKTMAAVPEGKTLVQGGDGLYRLEELVFDVTFDSDGGSAVEAQSVPYGQKATKPANPKKDGYVFKSWQLNGETYNFATPVTENIELTAQWAEAVMKYTAANGNVTYYDSIPSAFSNNGTYQLLKDVTRTTRMTPGILASNVVLDLNGHTLTSTASDCAILLSRAGTEASHKTFSIVDTSGEGGTLVVNTAANAAIQAQSKYNDIAIGENVTIDGGCIALLSENQTLTVDGTVNGGGDFAIATNGSSTKGAAIAVGEGAVLTSDSIAMYLPGVADVTVKGSVTGATAIYQKSGTLTIADPASLIATGEAADYQFNGNGANATGDALVVESCGYPGGAPVAKIEGGTITSANAKQVAGYHGNGVTALPEVDATVDTLTVPDNETWVEDADLGYTLVEAVTVTFDADGGAPAPEAQKIAKGAAATEPAAPAKEGFLFAGWTLNDAAYDFDAAVNESIELKAKWSGVVAKIGETGYASLADAVAAASAGDTIVMVDDEELDATVVVNKAVTLDLAGHKLYNEDADIYNEGTGDWSLLGICADVTITGNGTLQSKADDTFAVDVYGGAKVAIESGTFVGNIHAVYVYEGELAINGGHFSVIQKDSVTPDGFVINLNDANRAAGTATATITGGTFQGFDPSNNVAEGAGTDFTPVGYTGTLVAGATDVWTVVKQEVVEIPTAESLVYNGQEQVGVPGLLGAPYALADNAATNVGDYTATATLASDLYIWSDMTEDPQEIAWSIAPADLSKLTVEAIPAQAYTGSAIEPDLTVKDGETTLTKDTDYTVAFEQNTDVGIAKVTITGMGNYAGEIVTYFAINEADSLSVIMDSISNVTYSGTPWTPYYDIVLYDINRESDIEADGYWQPKDSTDGKCYAELVYGLDYDLTFMNNVEPGTATVIATLKGNYEGAVTGTFKIEAAVAKIGDAYYATLQDALDEVEDNETIELLADVEENAVYSDDAKFNLDLGGKTLTGRLTVNNGDVTVENGTVKGRLDAYDASTVTLAASAAVDGQVVVWGDGEGDAAKAPTLNVYGTVANEGGSAITTNGTDKSGAKINIYEGAEVTSTDDIAVYLPSGNLTVGPGTITGATAIYQKSGTVAVSGGELVATGEAADYEYYGNGAYATGDALVVDSCGYPNGVPVTNITGGTFSSVNGKQVAGYYGNGETELATVTSIGDALSVPDNEMWLAEGEGFKLVEAVTVTFDADGGTEVEAQKIQKGTAATEPADPTKDGYFFKEWQIDGAAYDFTTPVDESIELKAAWYVAVDKPEAENFTYDGTEKTGVAAAEGYTLGGTAKATNAGNYTATAALDENGSYIWSDGTTDPVELKWSIDKAEAVVTIDNASKAYGEADPALTATVTGVIEDETINYTLSRDEGEDVGAYKITAEFGENPNYNVTGVPGTFTITKADEDVWAISVDDQVNYDGTAQDGNLKVKIGETEVEAGNYQAIYQNNVDPGTATVIVIGKGNLTGVQSATFEIANTVDKTALEAAIDAAEEALDGVVPSADGKDVAPGTKWATPDEIDALKAAIAEAQATLDDPKAVQGTIDAATAALVEATENFSPKTATADKDALNAAIEAAQADYNVTPSSTEDPYEPYADEAAHQALQEAIDAAAAVANDPIATQNQIDEALAAVEAAQAAFDAAKKTIDPSKEELLAAIADAQTDRAATTVGESADEVAKDEHYVTQAQKDALSDAIAAAIAVANDPAATQAQIDAAKKAVDDAKKAFDDAKDAQVGTKTEEAVDKTDLIAAINDAQQDRADTAVGESADEVDEGVSFVTQEEKDALSDAIAAAIAVANDPAATQDQVDAAKEALDAAKQAFDEAKQTGTKTEESVDKSELEAAIAAAKADRAGTEVSPDGTDVAPTDKWTDYATRDALSDAIAAAAAVAANPASTQAEVDAAKEALDAAKQSFDAAKKPGTYEEPVVPEPADTSALESAIAAAKADRAGTEVSPDGTDVDPADKWTDYATRDALSDAIAAAAAVAANPASSQDEVDAAAAAVKAAQDAFDAAKKPGTYEEPATPEPPDTSALESAIAAAKADRAGTEVSSDGTDVDPADKWTDQAARDLLNDAIAAAAAVAANPASTQDEVDAAATAVKAAQDAFDAAKKAGTYEEPVVPEPADTSALEDAIAAAKADRAGTEVSSDGTDVDPADKWTDQAARDALTDAIAQAAAISSNPAATQEQVDAAKKAVDDAKAAFDAAKKPGTYEEPATPEPVDTSALEKAIEQAQAARTGTKVSNDGTDVAPSDKWTDADARDTLNDAIAAAAAVAANPAATQAEVDAAKKAVDDAKAAFEAAKKNGTYEEPAAPEVADTKALEDAITAAQAAREGTKVSNDGTDVDPADKWTDADARDALNDAIAAAAAVASNPAATQAEVDAAKKAVDDAKAAFNKAKKNGTYEEPAAPEAADTKALEKAIEQAQAARTGTKVSNDGTDVAPTDKWTDADARDALNDAINAAAAIASNPASTQAEVDAAKKAVDDAKAAFEAAKKPGTYEEPAAPEPADTKALEKAIAAAQADRAGTKVSNDGTDVDPADQWTDQAARDALSDAIGLAAAVAANPASTQDQVDAAKKAVDDAKAAFDKAKKAGTYEEPAAPEAADTKALEDAIAAAKADRAGTEVSADGTDVDPADQWTDQAARDALNDAIAAAAAVAANPAATQDDVDAATAAVKAAQDAFDKAKKAGAKEPEKVDKDALKNAIKAAQDDEAGTKVSKDGKDIDPADKWVPQAEKDKLDAAIAAANKVLNDPNATQDDVDAATAAVKAAQDAFDKAKKNGTKPAEKIWERKWGENAFGTMKEVVNEGFSSADTVIIATSEGYWDALTASALAGVTNAPILLTNPKSLSAETRSEIARLGATKAYIVGGTVAVEQAVENQVKGMGLTVKRLAGEDATLTACEIAKEVQSISKNSTCIIATVNGFYDALSIAPYAYATGTPIYLTTWETTLNSQTVAQIKASGATNAIIIGGTMAVSASVPNQLRSGTSVSATSRKSGANAWETSAAIADWELSQGMTVNNMGVADGNGYWDALTGAALIGKNNAVLVLVPHTGENADGDHFEYNPYCIDNFIAKHADEIKHGYVFGGTAVVPESTFDLLEKTTSGK